MNDESTKTTLHVIFMPGMLRWNVFFGRNGGLIFRKVWKNYFAQFFPYFQKLFCVIFLLVPTNQHFDMRTCV